MTQHKLSEYVKNGKRLDGRGIDDIRPITIEAGVLERADGSAYLEWGQNKVLVGVFGPKEALPKHTQNPYRAKVDYIYRMATFSVPDRKNPRPARREIEISKVSADALEAAIFTERFPNCSIEVSVEILDSNAGTRAAALTAASVALVDAGIPMRDMVSSCGVGKAGGHILVDLNKDEEDAPDAVDIPMAIMPKNEEIVLMQMDGLFTKDELKKATKKGIEACKKVWEIQKDALRKRYADAEKEIPAETEKVIK
ncbi:MAG: exosome complex exonuclease Rrp41 [Candidatus Diapherotrites archaeon]